MFARVCRRILRRRFSSVFFSAEFCQNQLSKRTKSFCQTETSRRDKSRFGKNTDSFFINLNRLYLRLDSSEKQVMKNSETSKSIAENGAGKNNDAKDFLVAGIGASAGGIQALKEFFENVPADSGVAYVVILHLSPDFDSRLAEVLQTVAAIPVAQVTERVKVEPNHVYVVPPNQHLEMLDGHIGVEPNTSVEERRAPVDIFFRTLAESHDLRAIAVVLSGTGADGSMGIKRIKERGGVAFVQNPREAEFTEMPRNSMATDLIDAVLNVAEIPAKILAYKKHLGTVEIPVEAVSRLEGDSAALREIFTVLRVRTGHDFTNYKRQTMLRRIERRINVRELDSLPTYAAYLKENPEEPVALLKDLLISVTNFFRDKDAFHFLETEVVPRILQDKRVQDEVRVWVAGCATSEEAYSIAMLLAERIEQSPVAPKIQIFAFRGAAEGFGGGLRAAVSRGSGGGIVRARTRGTRQNLRLARRAAAFGERRSLRRARRLLRHL
jgi:two-component system CheB/CheR fusion protein